MKLSQERPPFAPVTITIESFDELVILHTAMGAMTAKQAQYAVERHGEVYRPASEYRMFDDINTLFQRLG